MGADQQFCLRWNNFHSNITSAFESLRDDEDFVDITLACEGRQIKAHKMVLSACSPYFRSLLKGNPCQHPIMFLKDVTFANLTSILDFMYHGEVNVSHNELATFLKTAEALKVRGLAEEEKRKDSESCNESSSPPPPRDFTDSGSPRPEEAGATDTHLSNDSPAPKRQRRRSGASVHSAEDTNETVLSDIRDTTSVKNEPQDYNDEDEVLSHSVEAVDIKMDTGIGGEDSEERNFGLSESVTISRSQAAMQQLQESFGSFLPGMGQGPGFLPHGASDMQRPPPFSLEGVQGLPPGISALPGPSMSQGAASQDASQDMRWASPSNVHLSSNNSIMDGISHTRMPLSTRIQQDGSARHPCIYCGREFTSRSNLSRHVRDHHTAADPSAALCPVCGKHCRNRSNVLTHLYRTHRITLRQLESFWNPLNLPQVTTGSSNSLPLQQESTAPSLASGHHSEDSHGTEAFEESSQPLPVSGSSLVSTISIAQDAVEVQCNTQQQPQSYQHHQQDHQQSSSGS